MKAYECSNCGFRVRYYRPQLCDNCKKEDTFREIQLSNMDREMKL